MCVVCSSGGGWSVFRNLGNQDDWILQDFRFASGIYRPENGLEIFLTDNVCTHTHEICCGAMCGTALPEYY